MLPKRHSLTRSQAPSKGDEIPSLTLIYLEFSSITFLTSNTLSICARNKHCPYVTLVLHAHIHLLSQNEGTAGTVPSEDMMAAATEIVTVYRSFPALTAVPKNLLMDIIW